MTDASRHEANLTARPKHVAARVERGKFAKGSTGNPGGRPAMPASIREMLANNAQRAVEAIVKYVGDSDPKIALQASQALLDRAYGKPQVQSDPVAFTLPAKMDGLSGLLNLHQALITATAQGQVTLPEAKDMSALIESHCRLIETTDLEARIEKLELEGGYEQTEATRA